MAANPTPTETIFLSFGAAGASDGLPATPYSRWDHIMDQGQGYLTNKRLRIMRGKSRVSDAVDYPFFTDETNFIIDTYLPADVGDVGPTTDNDRRPRTLAAEQISSGSWTVDAGLSNANYLSGHITPRSVAFDERQMILYADSADMLLDIDHGMWWDTATDRTYVNPSITPGQWTTYVTRNASLTYAIHFLRCDNFILRDCDFQHGAGGGINVDECNDALFENNRSICHGNWVGGGEQCFRVGGVVSGAKSTGLVFRRNIMGQGVNNLFEIKDVDGALLEFNVGRDSGQGLEIWGNCINSIFRGNLWTDIVKRGLQPGHGQPLWMTSSALSAGETGNSTGNQFIGETYKDGGVTCIDIDQDNGNNSFFRCSLLNYGGTGLEVSGTQTQDITLDQCIFNTFGTSAFVNSVSGGRVVFDNNQYYTSGFGGKQWVIEGTTIPPSKELNGQVAFDAFVAVTSDTGQYADFTELN